MSNYNSLRGTIDANIKQNGRQEITGQILNSVLNQMVTTLGAGYQFAGVATLDPATDPGTPDAKVFYIANGKGTYTNFGGVEVTEDDVVVLYWDSSWHKVSTGIASQEKLSELESETNNATGLLTYSGYISVNNGKFIEYAQSKATGYLPIDKSGDIVINGVYCPPTAAILAFYDKDKNNLANIAGDRTFHFVCEKSNIPENAKYIRVSGTDFNADVSIYCMSIVSGVSLLAEELNLLQNETTEIKTAIEVVTNKVDSIGEELHYGASSFNNNGYYISAHNGQLVEYPSYKTTDFIFIDKEYPIQIDNISASSSVAVLAFYDKDKNYISSIIGNDTISNYLIEKVSIPTNAYFIRICGEQGYLVNTKIINGSALARFNNENVLLDENAFSIDGCYISITTGEPVQFATTKVTDFIPFIREYGIIVGTLSCPTGARVLAFYDKSKRYISEGSITGTDDNQFIILTADEIPEDAYYIRCTSKGKPNDFIFINGNSKEKWLDFSKSIKNEKPIKFLILGDSYSEGGGQWIKPMVAEFPQGSEWISLAVSSAKLKDRSNDRETYPYTSRPKSDNNEGNNNTLGCQIQKLKRLMAGVDLDEGETQIYTSEKEYPDVIIIEGGMNDDPDSQDVVNKYMEQLEKIVTNVYVATRPGDTPSVGSANIKTPLDEVDRTCFAGAYRYIMDELIALFPNAQIYITTASPISYRRGYGVGTSARNKAEQQRFCADIFSVNVIDWHRDGQINFIQNYTRGSGTENDPYLIAYQSGDNIDTIDQLHPNARGGKKYGRLAAKVIKQTFLDIKS